MSPRVHRPHLLSAAVLRALATLPALAALAVPTALPPQALAEPRGGAAPGRFGSWDGPSEGRPGAVRGRDDVLVLENRWDRPVVFAVRAGREDERRPDILMTAEDGRLERLLRTGPVRPGDRVRIGLVGDWSRDRDGVVDERFHVTVLDARGGRGAWSSRGARGGIELDRFHRTVVLRGGPGPDRWARGYGSGGAWPHQGNGYGTRRGPSSAACAACRRGDACSAHGRR
jgi:hypothetical protein